MSLPDKLYVWDNAAKPGRPVREHLIPQKDGVDIVVKCGHNEPGEVEIKIAKHFNMPGFRFSKDAAGKQPFEFPVKQADKDASGGVRLSPGQTVANYDELMDGAVEDRCKLAGIDTDGMNKKQKIAALLKSDGVASKSKDEDDEDEDLDLELEDDDDRDPDDDGDDDDIVNGAAGA
ncbi:hypothetical protein [Thalassospira aquimaris]|uniref:Uncharacterized protein n=1 Tax=Thalassospira aquimaris TaxID=3037796 RepID=A0ABT6GH45_9PROT|nr:hypothetical protein [Thalassospira sp. FZY0004]MDG4721157.1 hypothetical protein [Thalassospira sp. FZY0004]